MVSKLMKTTVFCVVAPCSLVVVRRFRGACCHHHHRSNEEGSKHLWNVGKLLPDFTAQEPRRQPFSYSPPLEPGISQVMSGCYALFEKCAWNKRISGSSYLCLSAWYNPRTARRIWMKFGTDVMPLESNLKSNFSNFFFFFHWLPQSSFEHSPPLIFWFPNLLRHMIGLLRRVISSLQGLYLHRTT
jgi:hypothetical protein